MKTPFQAPGKLRSFFLWSCLWVLVFTAGGKALALLGGAESLHGTDEILLMPKRVLLELTVALEVVVGIAVFWHRRTPVAFFALAWFSSVLLSYRLVRALFGVTFPCACLGIFTAYLPLTAQGASVLMTFIAIYMLTGSLLGLLGR